MRVKSRRIETTYRGDAEDAEWKNQQDLLRVLRVSAVRNFFFEK
jgi:hypothetical protein